MAVFRHEKGLGITLDGYRTIGREHTKELLIHNTQIHRSFFPRGGTELEYLASRKSGV